MKMIETYLDAIQKIQLDCHEDDRGFFMEIFNVRDLRALGITQEFVQDNCSFSARRGTVRGLHFQNEPYAQTKLLRCTKGSIYDISVDVRRGSPTFGKAVAVHLTCNDHCLLLVPKGFAHGVVILEDGSEYNYKVDNLFNKESEGTLAYDYDPDQLDWRKMLGNTELILSERDRHNPQLADCNTKFVWGK